MELDKIIQKLKGKYPELEKEPLMADLEDAAGLELDDEEDMGDIMGAMPEMPEEEAMPELDEEEEY